MPEFMFDHFAEFLGGYMFVALAMILFTGLTGSACRWRRCDDFWLP